MILGRTVWKRHSGGWQSEDLDSGAHPNVEGISRIREIIAANPSARASVVFEPEGFVHESVETPNVGRTVFASLERIKNEHPVVSTRNLGWGIEKPELVAGGVYSTLIHSEMAPGLVHLRNSCAHREYRLLAAWSVYSVIEAIVRDGRSTLKARRGVILTQKYVAVANCSPGKRSFRAWVGTMSERDWKVFSMLTAGREGKTLASAADFENAQSNLFVISEGNPARHCPFWNDVIAAGRVDKVMDIDELAERAAKLPLGHSANLLEGFPSPRELDRYLVTVTVMGALTFAIFGVLARSESEQFRNAEKTGQRHLTELYARLNELKRNQREISVLQKQILDRKEMLPVSKHGALLALTAAIPDAVTLTSLVIGRNGNFEIEALIDQARFNSERARKAIENAGFIPEQDAGWKYDAEDSILKIRGKYTETSQ